ncbi:Conserved hypothetical protein [Prochlorococcus marinus str. MIT 9303]|uniref:Uncharacterized protein n=1 Tax=Prochlorococcus marinus (strain MIT 9303) TaxID=59922 RepID=A2CDV6_PROM3|nr:Conserved hypothetical protein [Prochlorococcus marinus str. MIT 9303]
MFQLSSHINIAPVQPFSQINLLELFRALCLLCRFRQDFIMILINSA